MSLPINRYRHQQIISNGIVLQQSVATKKHLSTVIQERGQESFGPPLRLIDVQSPIQKTNKKHRIHFEVFLVMAIFRPSA